LFAASHDSLDWLRRVLGEQHVARGDNAEQAVAFTNHQ
jgi:hypothetical protein